MSIILAYAKALLIFHLSDMGKTSTTTNPAPTDDSLPISDTKVVEATEPAVEEIIAPTPQILTLNCVNLIGRVGANIEIRFFESGSAKATLSLAVRRRAKDAPPPPSTIKVVAWGENLVTQLSSLRSAQQCVIQGRLSMNTIERPEGFREKITELIAERIIPL